jgi:hypothetical protein
MLDFTKMATTWFSHIDHLSTPSLLRLFQGGAMLAKLFSRSNLEKSRTAEQEKAGAGSVS